MAAPAEIAPDGLSQWEPGPPHPALAKGVVHVWRADLGSVDDAVLRWLSKAERERGARIVDPAKGVLWARSRGVLRELLARYTGLAADEIRLRVDPRGKPRLEARPSDGELLFNLSHSGRLGLFAFSSEGPVGVDVERSRPPREARASCAGSGEARGIRLNDPPDQRAGVEFLRRWSRAEAVGKCLGTGVGVEAGSARVAPAGVWVGDLEVGADWAGAIATRHPPAAVRRFDWCNERERAGG